MIDRCALLLLLPLAASLAACGEPAAAPPPNAPTGAVTATSGAPPPTKVEADFRVLTVADFQIHGGHAKGRWFRRVAGGWEGADCTESINPDSPEGNTGPACATWSKVPADQARAVDEAAAAGHDTTTCAKQPALCATLGLR